MLKVHDITTGRLLGTSRTEVEAAALGDNIVVEGHEEPLEVIDTERCDPLNSGRRYAVG